MQTTANTGPRVKRQAMLRFTHVPHPSIRDKRIDMRRTNVFCGRMQTLEALKLPSANPFHASSPHFLQDVLTRLAGNTLCLQMPKEWREWTRKYEFAFSKMYATNLQGHPLPDAHVFGMACFYDVVCDVFNEALTADFETEIYKFCIKPDIPLGVDMLDAAYLDWNCNKTFHLAVRIWNAEGEVTETFHILLQAFLQRVQALNALPDAAFLPRRAPETATGAVEPPPMAPDAVEANAEDDFPPDLEAFSAPPPVDAATQMALDIGAAMELEKAAKQATAAALSSLPTPLKAEQAGPAGQAEVASATSCVPVPPQATDVTETGYNLTLGSFMESYVIGTDKSPEDEFAIAQLCTKIHVLRGTKDDPRDCVDLAAYGVATGKWSETCKAKQVIKLALEFKNSGECDGSQCKNDQTGKHMLCNMDTTVVETTHHGNGSKVNTVYAPIDDTTTWSCHNIPAIKALGTKAFRSVTGADGAAAQMAIGTSAVMAAALPGRSVVAALGRANDERPPQVEHTQTEETFEDEDGATSTRQTQQTRIETEGGGSLTVERGVEEGQHPDGSRFVRLGQNMRVEDREGASVEAGRTIEIGSEFYSFMRELNQATINNTTTLLNGMQQQRRDDMAGLNTQLVAIDQQRQNDMAGLNTQIEAMQEQRLNERAETAEQIDGVQSDFLNIDARVQAMEKSFRQQRQQSAGPPKKRGRAPKSVSAGSAGASSKKTALANEAKRVRNTSLQVNNVQSYPDEERKKDAELEMYFEPWDRNLVYNIFRDFWQVRFYNKKRSKFNTPFSSNFFSFADACDLRRELCKPIKYRNEAAKTAWSVLYSHTPPERMVSNATSNFVKMKQNLN